jgi:hypothetical protein
MEKVVFADCWQQILADNGLKTFDDIYDCDNSQRINKNNKRNVSILRLKTREGEKKVFPQTLSRFTHQRRSLCFMNTGKFVSQAAYEWDNKNALQNRHRRTNISLLRRKIATWF